MKIYIAYVVICTLAACFLIHRLDQMNASNKVIIMAIAAYILLGPICNLIIKTIAAFFK